MPPPSADPTPPTGGADSGGGGRASLADGWAAAVLVGAAAVLASPVRGLGFVHDDRALLEQSTRLADPSTLWTALGSDLFWLSDGAVRASPYWRPWVTLTYYLDHALGGGAPAVFHLHNALVAIILALVVWWGVGRGWRGCVLGLLALLHPVMVEPLANITARTDLYVALFGTASLLLPRGWRLGALALALGSKETAVVVPLLWGLQALGRDPRLRAALRSVGPGVWVVGGWLAVRALLVGGRAAGLPWEGWPQLPATLGVAVLRLLAPATGPHPDVDLSHLPSAPAVVACGGAVLVGLGLVRLARTGKGQVAAGLGMVLLPLLLTSGLAGPGIRMADGLLAWPVVGLVWVAGRLPGRAVAMLAPLVGVLAWGHAERVAVWASPETLWSAALHARPADPRVQLKAGRVQLARSPARAESLAAAIQSHPDPRLRREGHELAARALLLQERDPAQDAALRAHLRRAADPTDVEAGWACAARCVWDEAAPDAASGVPDRAAVCAAAVALGAESGDVWNTRGVLAAGRFDLPAARAAFARAVSLDPARREFRDNLALAEQLIQDSDPSVPSRAPR